jgi:glycerol kinase
MRVLAIDQGTTSTRGIVFGPGERTLVYAAEHRQIYPRPGWVEHDPEELLAGVRACIDRAGAVDAIGIANQGESCLAWDGASGAAASPVIVWQDARTEARVAALRDAGAEPGAKRRSGLPLDPYFSASKLGWILETLPEARRLAEARRLRLGTTDAFFLDRLAGRFVTDVTTASRTGLMDLRTLRWDEELCRLHGVPPAALPTIIATTGDFGTVDCGGREVPVAASLVDQQAALYGHGCRVPGDTKVTFGTGAFALAVTGPGEPVAAEGLLATVAWQKAGEAPTYALEGGVYSAGAAVNWARGLGLFADFAEIDRFEAPPAVGRGLVFVPALAGLAAPHWDRGARGGWLGIGLETGRSDLMQAVIEGVALRTAEVVAGIRAAVPEAGRISIDGGMSANGYFAGFLAAVLGTAVRVSGEPELTARGAAALAAEAAGGAIDPAPESRIVPCFAPLPDALPRFRRAVGLLRLHRVGEG